MCIRDRYTYGRGIAQYLNDISNLNVDIVPLADESGRMQDVYKRQKFEYARRALLLGVLD